MTKENSFINILILNVIMAVYSFLGFFSKLAASESFLSAKFMLFYGIVLAGLFLYAIVWQQLLKRIPLITAYTNKAVTVIWGIVWGYICFGEAITVKKVIGAFVIIAGVLIVIRSDYKTED